MELTKINTSLIFGRECQILDFFCRLQESFCKAGDIIKLAEAIHPKLTELTALRYYLAQKTQRIALNLFRFCSLVNPSSSSHRHQVPSLHPSHPHCRFQ